MPHHLLSGLNFTIFRLKKANKRRVGRQQLAVCSKFFSMISVTELRAGTTFKDSQGIWEAIKYSHTKMGRGSASIKVKVKNLKTGTIVDKTFTSGQKVDDLSVTKKEGQFLYADGSNLVFMEKKTFEQFTLPKTAVFQAEKFLKESETYDLTFAEDSVIGVEIPRTVVLRVDETGPAIKGDSVSAASKDATLENGLSLKVPLFIKTGDKIKVDARAGKYVERVR
ncbi:MAG: elongation factor P [Candidatus Woykebacteria bacterium]